MTKTPTSRRITHAEPTPSAEMDPSRQTRLKAFAVAAAKGEALPYCPRRNVHTGRLNLR